MFLITTIENNIFPNLKQISFKYINCLHSEAKAALIFYLNAYIFDIT